MGIGSLAWHIPRTYSMLLLLYEPYFTIACGQRKGVLGGFLSLQCLRDTVQVGAWLAHEKCVECAQVTYASWWTPCGRLCLPCPQTGNSEAFCTPQLQLHRVLRKHKA